jgi:hypothetical protein
VELEADVRAAGESQGGQRSNSDGKALDQLHFHLPHSTGARRPSVALTLLPGDPPRMGDDQATIGGRQRPNKTPTGLRDIA